MEHDEVKVFVRYKKRDPSGLNRAQKPALFRKIKQQRKRRKIDF